jgi:dTDP-4-dehydrorhamnose reductase
VFKPKTYVVVGAHGQLGRDLCKRLAGNVIEASRPDADLCQPEGLRSLLQEHQPAVVFNCAAYNFVDRAEAEPEAAFAVNAWGVRNLARLCGERDCLLVHFSSDYVFGLELDRHAPYKENVAPGPLSVYGLSKLAGEYLVRSLCPRHLVIRTCGLYGVWGSGGKGGNFVETMLQAAASGKPLSIVADQVCTPSYTVDVAAGVIDLVHKGANGLYHLVNSGSCSWYEFAATIFSLAGITAQMTPISTQAYGAVARRPLYSVLSTQAVQELGLPPLRSYQEALGAYLEERGRLA